MVRVVNIRCTDPNDGYNVYIGRDTKLWRKLKEKYPALIDGTDLGNPVTLDKDSTRDEVLDAHAEYFKANTDSLKPIIDKLVSEGSQRTVNLVCWCKPKRCHGDIIADHLNQRIQGPSIDIEEYTIF